MTWCLAFRFSGCLRNSTTVLFIRLFKAPFMKGSVKGSIRGPLRALQRALLGVLLGLISGGVNVWNRGFKSGCTRIDTSLHTTYIYLSISPSIYLAASSPAIYLPSICVCVCMYIYIYIYVYAYLCSPLPPPPHDRPSWERGRVVSVPRHDLSTDWNSKVSNFSQNLPPPFFPEIPEFQFSPQS